MRRFTLRAAYPELSEPFGSPSESAAETAAHSKDSLSAVVYMVIGCRRSLQRLNSSFGDTGRRSVSMLTDEDIRLPPDLSFCPHRSSCFRGKSVLPDRGHENPVPAFQRQQLSAVALPLQLRILS